jgi:hypothetical protein
LDKPANKANKIIIAKPNIKVFLVPIRLETKPVNYSFQLPCLQSSVC